MNKWKICALVLPLSVVACSGRSGAEDAVRQLLKDPDSAKFGEFYYNASTSRACLTTNAKNSMGGYTGNKEVRLTKDSKGWHYESEREETHEDCRSDYADETRSQDQVVNDAAAAIME